MLQLFCCVSFQWCLNDCRSILGHFTGPRPVAQHESRDDQHGHGDDSHIVAGLFGAIHSCGTLGIFSQDQMLAMPQLPRVDETTDDEEAAGCGQFSLEGLNRF